jgi:hypothetical protein
MLKEQGHARIGIGLEGVPNQVLRIENPAHASLNGGREWRFVRFGFVGPQASELPHVRVEMLFFLKNALISYLYLTKTVSPDKNT